MTATLDLFGYTADASTASGASRIALNTNSALSFGGTGRTTFQGNITINTYNQAMHFAKNNNESGNEDYCPSPHLYPLTYLSATASLIGGTYWNMTGTAVAKSARGICGRFRVTTEGNVKVSPAYIWAGSGANVDQDTINADIQLCSLGSAQPTWREATSSGVGKLLCSAHATAALEHWYSFGVSIKPTAVGFNDSNKIKIELTYY